MEIIRGGWHLIKGEHVAKKEVFPNPTVQEVIFQIRFPNLFFLPDKIGDFQVKIMKDFPESKMLVRRTFVFAQGEKEKLKAGLPDSEGEPVTKVWQFSSPAGVELQITASSLSLVSKGHKTYAVGGDQQFRPVIASVTAEFLKLTGVPVLSRVGLRYRDEPPVPKRSAVHYSNFYKTALPVKRFPLEHSDELSVTVVSHRKDCRLRYIESLTFQGDQPKLILDFDAWADNVESDKLMEVTDNLHDVISAEFFGMIKEPVLKHMRRPKEAAHAGTRG